VNFSVRQETGGDKLYGEGELTTPFAACEVAVKGSVSKENSGSSVVCPHCNKKMVPRVTMRNGYPSESFCPFCGGSYKKFPMFWIKIFATIVVVIIVLIIFGVLG
jgi:hypothetical protein